MTNPSHLLERLAFAPLFPDFAGIPFNDSGLWMRRRDTFVCEDTGVAPARFSEIAPSLQVHAPRGAGLRIQMAAMTSEGPTRFYDLGWHGDLKRLPPRRHLKDTAGTVDTDLLRLTEPARQWCVRLTAIGGEPWRWRWGMAGVTWRPRAMHREAASSPPLKRTVQIAVPVASQMAEGGKDGPVACSPTCMQMQMAHRGVSIPVPRVMKAAYDPINAIYGNWQRAIAAAWEFGLPAAFVYLRHWGHVLECLRAGVPVGASIKFPKGKVHLPGAPIEHSNGHLLVIRGLTPGGEVICNDPAAKTREGVPVCYPLEAFTRAWFGFSGVGYLVFPPRRAKSAATPPPRGSAGRQ